MLISLTCLCLQEDAVQRHTYASLASCQALGPIHERFLQGLLRPVVGYPGPALVLKTFAEGPFLSTDR